MNRRITLIGPGKLSLWGASMCRIFALAFALAGVVMLTATQAFAGCTRADLEAKINAEKRDQTGLPGQAYFDFATQCASSAPADVMQAARDWAASKGIHNPYQTYRDDQQAAADAIARQNLRDQQAIQKNRQEADQWILKMERECKSGSYCDPDAPKIIDDYRRRHPDLPSQQLGGAQLGPLGSQQSPGRGVGGIRLDVDVKKTVSPSNMPDIHDQVLKLKPTSKTAGGPGKSNGLLDD